MTNRSGSNHDFADEMVWLNLNKISNLSEPQILHL